MMFRFIQLVLKDTRDIVVRHGHFLGSRCDENHVAALQPHRWDIRKKDAVTGEPGHDIDV